MGYSVLKVACIGKGVYIQKELDILQKKWDISRKS